MQDRAAGTMHFSLAKPGMLKFFEGQWTVSAVEGENPSVGAALTLPGHVMSNFSAHQAQSDLLMS